MVICVLFMLFQTHNNCQKCFLGHFKNFDVLEQAEHVSDVESSVLRRKVPKCQMIKYSLTQNPDDMPLQVKQSSND